jgi:hypothetical protein
VICDSGEGGRDQTQGSERRDRRTRQRTNSRRVDGFAGASRQPRYR